MAHYFRIDHQLKLLAVFSPKCASNSIHKWLDGLARETGQGDDFVRQDSDQINPNQLPDYADYLTVLFLRDPLRRLVSFYAHWVVRHPGPWDFADQAKRLRLSGKSFRGFLYTLEHLSRHGLRFQHHLEPQTVNLPEFQFRHVALTENLHEEIRALNAGLGYRVQPGNNNRTARNVSLKEFVGDRTPRWLEGHGIPRYQWFYDRETADLARGIYASDVALYEAHGGRILDPAGSGF